MKNTAKLKDLLYQNKNYLRIKVRPLAKEAKIANFLEDQTIKINIKSPPERGKANQELIKFLAKILEISPKDVTIISGKTQKLKLVKITSNKF